MWGQGFGPAAGLLAGAGLYVSGSLGDLVAGVLQPSEPPLQRSVCLEYIAAGSLVLIRVQPLELEYR